MKLKPWVLMKSTPTGQTMVSFYSKSAAEDAGLKWLDYRKAHGMSGTIHVLKKKRLKGGSLTLQSKICKSVRKR